MSCEEKEYECPLDFGFLKELELAYASGVTEIEYDGKRIKYDSAKQMLKRIYYVKAKLGLVSPASSRSGLFGGKRLTMRPSKGLNNCKTNKEHQEDERFDRNEDI